MDLLWIYLLIINALSFCLMLIDKHKARKNKWRIPEATLLGSALIGGSLGAWLGMFTARHKTRKPAFRIGIPLMLLLHIALFTIWVIKNDTFK